MCRSRRWICAAKSADRGSCYTAWRGGAAGRSAGDPQRPSRHLVDRTAVRVDRFPVIASEAKQSRSGCWCSLCQHRSRLPRCFAPRNDRTGFCGIREKFGHAATDCRRIGTDRDAAGRALRIEPARLDVRLHAARRVRLRRYFVRGSCCRARMACGGRQLRLGSRHRRVRADGRVHHLRLGRRSHRSQEDHHPGMLVVRRLYVGLGVGAVDTRADGAALSGGCRNSTQRCRMRSFWSANSHQADCVRPGLC